MCEFKVYLKDFKRENIVAEDVVYAKSINNEIILKGVLGDSISIKNAIIEEVDVSNEVLRLAIRS
jgi:predicted RNA-binding protein